MVALHVPTGAAFDAACVLQAIAGMNAQALTDEELMRAYVGGDAAAFRVLFDRFGPRIHRMVRRHLPSDADAQDLVQQTFLQLHRARNDFRDGAAVRPWVLTIAMNLLRERWRSGKRRRIVPLESETLPAPNEAGDPIERRRARERVVAAVTTLPDNQREVIELHWFQELPFAEVAAILGVKEGAVRVRAHRAYERLQRILHEEIPT